ncbi:MAG: hypothetical protein A2677_03665 [Candidatus Komeilibacteria bacterium RIFCSPHIGHO2_01_FULL_52_14]|uniref:Cytotoxic translational repressor of toxin-antitoxin stability system n=1 Tax=Candidatus Komeilibacteria bacterium RIFCSPHIGHO2_01_FULL_52_14 TaxID=1798549 RepID=A0A1G2BKB7_9BACT|nr:MAG: hypothetical protein A2677_03665 [Candidatus Komeilibacteria bacterium RIFCSPHIGHO2_01_FULL_52_14]
MDRIEKLLRKISRKDREGLLNVVELLARGHWKGLNVVKLRGTDLYRLRHGRFRIIFHREDTTHEVVIDSIKLRREDTYKKLN